MTIEASIGQTYNALGRCGLVAQAMKTCGGDANNVQATIPQLLAPLRQSCTGGRHTTSGVIIPNPSPQETTANKERDEQKYSL